jgi:apolipoprotein N-acyltransferase
MHLFLQKLTAWYIAKNRWWMPLLAGCLYPLAFAPFSPETHWVYSLFPLYGFAAIVPLFIFALVRPLKRAVGQLYLFGLTAAFFQFYWIANVVAEGLWHMILIGLACATLFFALYFLAAGLLFRITFRFLPRFTAMVFPSAWLLLEWVRGNGEIAFPWNYLGYSFAQILPLGQLASACGIYGLSFIAVIGNVLVWDLLRAYQQRCCLRRQGIAAMIFIAFLACAAVWGALRIKPVDRPGSYRTVACIQSNIDQARWGSGSLDTTLSITEALLYKSCRAKPDLILLPESALFCYLMRRPMVQDLVIGWSDSIKAPMVLGTLHWDRLPIHKGEESKYAVYNSAFLVDAGPRRFTPYYKMTLLPFSETMPLKGVIPLINRLDLGGSDFTAGKVPVLFSIRDSIRAVPLICYEIIMPGQVRARITAGANMLVNITNDGWFGRSTAPFQHAFMARMRCIENGIAMARCANSGISMQVDPYGRVLRKTGLYERTICSGRVGIERVKTLYSRLGDWPLWVAVVVVLLSIGWVAVSVRRKGALKS